MIKNLHFTRRALMSTVRNVGVGAIATGFGSCFAQAATQTTDIDRLYADWKRKFETRLPRSISDDELDVFSNELHQLEERIFKAPTTSVQDLYRKIVISDAHGVMEGFDLELLVAEAREALGDDVPVL